MRAIFVWSVRQRKWFMLWWLLGTLLAVGINIAFYPSFKDQAAELDKSLAQIPETARAFISSSSDFFSPIGFLNTQIYYLMLPMLLTILSISLGSSAIAREERDGTLELLLARPVSRTSLLGAKLLACAVISLTVATAAGTVVVLLSRVVGLPVAAPNILLTTAVAWLLSFSFGLTALMVTTLGKSARLGSIGLAALLALGSYIISSLYQVVSWLEWPAKVLPFSHYRPLELLGGTVETADLVYLVGLSLVCIIVSIIAFRRRDIGN